MDCKEYQNQTIGSKFLTPSTTSSFNIFNSPFDSMFSSKYDKKSLPYTKLSFSNILSSQLLAVGSWVRLPDSNFQCDTTRVTLRNAPNGVWLGVKNYYRNKSSVVAWLYSSHRDIQNKDTTLKFRRDMESKNCIWRSVRDIFLNKRKMSNPEVGTAFC